MNTRGIIYVVAAVLIAVFVLANWNLVTGSVELSLLIARIRAPLGLLILMITAIIVLVEIGVHALNRRAWSRERRALRAELESTRLRADSEENSRIAALQSSMEKELATIRAKLDGLIANQSSRLLEPSAGGYSPPPHDVPQVRLT